MPEGFAQTFIDALRDLEENNNVDRIASLFADECRVGNSAMGRLLEGPDGAKEFWANYRKSFGEIHSDFRNKIVSGNVAALEWVSEGTAPNGNTVHYAGVSIVQSDGVKINRFFAYFDPNSLGAQISESARA
jgi:SnoaL-like domain